MQRKVSTLAVEFHKNDLQLGVWLEAETGNLALAPKALALLRVIRGYEQRVRRLTLKADYRVARILPRGN
jgi:hypothetical protein